MVYVSLPEVGATVAAGDACGEVESTKSVSDIYAPVSGTVTDRNAELDQHPDLVNTDPYGAGWLFEISPTSADAVDGLLDAATYRAQIGEETPSTSRRVCSGQRGTTPSPVDPATALRLRCLESGSRVSGP